MVVRGITILHLIGVTCLTWSSSSPAQAQQHGHGYTSSSSSRESKSSPSPSALGLGEGRLDPLDARYETDSDKVTPRIKILSSRDPDVFIDRKIRLVSKVSPPDFRQLTAFPVVKIIDPTTFIISYDGRPRLVRLQGLNQTSKQYSVATGHLTSLLQDELVFLEFDENLSTRDEDGNLVAYVFRFSDKTLVNQSMIEAGLSLAATGYKFEYRRLFEWAQKSAQDQQQGVWAIR